jgi:WD40 repeat protein
MRFPDTSLHSRAALLALVGIAMAFCQCTCGPSPRAIGAGSSAATDASGGKPRAEPLRDPRRAVVLAVASGDRAAARTLLDRSGAVTSVERADVPSSTPDPVFSADGRHVALRMGRSLHVMDLEALREMGPPIAIDVDDEHLNYELSPDGAQVAVVRSTGDGDVALHRTGSAELLARHRTDVVHGTAAFSRDGRLLAYATQRDAGSRVANWLVFEDTRTLETVQMLPYGFARSIEFLPDGWTVRLGATTYDLQTGSVIADEPPGLVKGPKGLGVHPDGLWSTPARHAPTVHDLADGRELGPLSAKGCEKAEGAFFAPVTATAASLVTIDGGRACLWDVASRALLRTIDVPLGGAPRIALMLTGHVRFTPDGRGLVITVARNEDYPRVHAHTYDLASGAEVEDLGKVLLLDDRIRETTGDVWLFDPDRGEILRVKSAAVAERRRVPFRHDELSVLGAGRSSMLQLGTSILRVLDPGTGDIRELPADPGAWSVRFSPDLRWLVGQRDDGRLRVWRLDTLTPVLTTGTAPPARTVTAVAFAPSGDTLTVATVRGGDDRIQLSTGAIRSTPDAPDTGNDPTSWATVAVAPDGTTIAIPQPTMERPKLRAMIQPTGKTVELEGELPGGLVGLVSVDGALKSIAVTYTMTGGWDSSETHVWDLATGKHRYRLPRIAASGAALDRSGKHLATIGNFAPGLEIWDGNTGRPMLSLPDVSGSDPVFSPDGSVLAYADQERVHLLSVRKKRASCVTPVVAGSPHAFFPDGDRFAATTAGGVSVFDASDCRLIRELSVPVPPIGLAVHPSARLLVAATRAGELTFLPVEGGEPVTFTLSNGAGAAFAGGKVELFGDHDLARRHAVCRSGGHVLPLELCEPDGVVTGLLSSVLR